VAFRGSLDHDASRAALVCAATADTPIELLDGLLAVWRNNHHPAIAELVDAAARRAAAQTAPPKPAPTILERQTQWLAIAREHRAIELAWLIEQLPVQRGELGIERIAALAAWPDDPRVVVGLLELCRLKPLTSSRRFWQMIFRQLRARLEAHALPLLRELATTSDRVTAFDNRLCSMLGWLVRASEQLKAPLEPAADAIEAIAARLDLASDRASKLTLDDLQREVWAAPRDDGPRHVLADWLTERNDPRGELIALQLARSRRPGDAAAMRRERALLDQNGRAWMGPLEPVVVSSSFVAFERGFLSRCEVAWRRLGAMPQLMTHPAWSTVREYRVASEGERLCNTWLDHMVALGAKRL
jgi:uncharacterized protein (TIGR02996 family)